MAFMVGDTEVAPNYFLGLWLDRRTGQTLRWERHNDRERGRSRDDLKAFLRANTTVGFNWDGFDFAIIAAYLHGFDNLAIKAVCDWLINSRDPLASYRVLEEFGIPPVKYPSIDIMPVMPLQGSLKLYAARARSGHIQDLPYKHDDLIDEDMRDRTIDYCEQDLANTLLLFEKGREWLKLRKVLSDEYGVNLLSMGDAKIAEKVMRIRIERAGGDARPMKAAQRPKPPFHYTPPDYLTFEAPELVAMFDRVRGIEFGLDKGGSLAVPVELQQVKHDSEGVYIPRVKNRPDPSLVHFAGLTYKVGIGGLHSGEKAMTVRPGPGEFLFFADVASYYPNLLLTNNWFPANAGKLFIEEYRAIVTRRLAAKAAGNKVEADALKIVVNSIFGKLGSRWSAFYDPEILLQVTLTGQLALLMLVEMITSRSGALVISGNTDGVLVHARSAAEHDAALLALRDWEQRTSLTLEEEYLSAVSAQDVNNYVALGTTGKIKGKGCMKAPDLTKNPVYPIVARALTTYLQDGTPVADTITACDDLHDFVALRKANGGATWRGEPIGSTCRWYAGKSGTPILTAGKGSQVANSERAVVCQTMPTGAALAAAMADVDRGYYVERARKQALACGVGSALST